MKSVISISLFEEAGGISGGIVTIMVASFFWRSHFHKKHFASIHTQHIRKRIKLIPKYNVIHIPNACGVLTKI